MRKTCRPGSPCAVLMIEDDSAIVELVVSNAARLEPGCFAIEPAGTLARAVEHLQGVSYDAVLLDLGLPDSQGLATLSALARVVNDQSPLIVLTGEDDAETELRCFDEGVAEFIPKPFDPQRLLMKIRHAILRHRKAMRDRSVLLEEVEMLRRVETVADKSAASAMIQEVAGTLLKLAHGHHY